MRGADITQATLFSYRTLEDRIPAKHPLCKLRLVVDAILASMHDELDDLYAAMGRHSIPPERLLRASLIQTLFTIRSERQLVQHIDFNLLYRWFVGLTIDDAVWEHSTFSANRDRLLNERIARSHFAKVVALAEWQDVLSDEHFSVDGTPHVAQEAKGSAIDGRTTRDAGYKTSMKIRKRIEEVFGWSKTVGGLDMSHFTRLNLIIIEASSFKFLIKQASLIVASSNT
jgi:transposase